MKYKELLDSHKKYGTSEKDILKSRDYDKIYENVVIAPWWGVETFASMNPIIERINDILFNIEINSIKFSYICLKGIGAPATIDEVLKLGVSKCKKLLFIGSVGSLNENIKIGDIVVPKYSVSGDGASRYLNKNLDDDFGKKQYPNKKFTHELISILDNYKDKVNYYNVPNFSVDSIFAQFAHIDYIKSLGCETIEMETATLFKASEITRIKASALFVVSDNTVTNKSLYSGRTEEENKYRHYVRYNIIPSIIIELFKN